MATHVQQFCKSGECVHVTTCETQNLPIGFSKLDQWHHRTLELRVTSIIIDEPIQVSATPHPSAEREVYIRVIAEMDLQFGTKMDSPYEVNTGP